MIQFDGCIELLSTQHDRRSFTCGEPALDEYLRRYAKQHAETKVSRTYVAAQGKTILGYYSLAMSAIRKDQLPVRHQPRFPDYPVPVARLARLAVDKRHQGIGLGELLLGDALYRCYRFSAEIGMVGVVVDAKNERAKAYYQRFEFEALPDSSLTLWLPATVIAKIYNN